MTDTYDGITEVWSNSPQISPAEAIPRRQRRPDERGYWTNRGSSNFARWSVFLTEEQQIFRQYEAELSRSLPRGRDAAVHRRMSPRHPGDEKAVEAQDLQAGIGDK